MRIIAGIYKGRKLLPPPRHSRTRPMTGAVKKSLFSMLEGRLGDAVVADLYCGTGTLGLEALSRGAKLVCFAERDRSVIQRLRRNILDFGVSSRSVIWSGEVESFLARRLSELGSPLDVAFVDPPFADVRRWSWERAAAGIFAPLASHLAPDGIVVLRADDRAQIPDSLGGLVKAKLRRYGNTVLAMFGPQGE